MDAFEKEKLVDKRQKNGSLAPVFRPSFTAYHEDAAAFDECYDRVMKRADRREERLFESYRERCAFEGR